MLTIGDLASKTGVNKSTIRYYEQMGLLSHSGRSEGNQRRYASADLQRLEFISEARELGLTIEAIRSLIDLSEQPQSTSGDIDQIVAAQLSHVRDKITRLRKFEKKLENISGRRETVGR